MKITVNFYDLNNFYFKTTKILDMDSEFDDFIRMITSIIVEDRGMDFRVNIRMKDGRDFSRYSNGNSFNTIFRSLKQEAINEQTL